MPVLTVRISDEEKTLLDRRARAAKLSSGAFVRQMLNEPQFTTGKDLLDEIARQTGNKKLRVRRVK